MAERKPLVRVGGRTRQLPAGDTLLGVPPEVATPINVSPANGATGVDDGATLTGDTYWSLYSAPQAASQWQIATNPSFSSLAYDSGDQLAGASFAFPQGVLAVSTLYYWRVRYKNARGTYSGWSTPTSFTTTATFNNYIPTPAATPATFGDAFEGGFYTGMVWDEIAQSATSTAIGTGTKVFTVADMSVAPVVYFGQQVEVRSRANPNNKMMGTVAGAKGTQLTISVTSVSGSGTLADWSVMARFRIIVAPKSSGENAGISIKNGNTVMPVATQTVVSGLRATQAMRDADTATVYPAAHWARALSIGGYADWYVPARDEFELIWRNLKPVTNNNLTGSRSTVSYNYTVNGAYGDASTANGLNANSAPAGAAYTATVPSQTSATAFINGGTEALESGTSYWTSSEASAANAWYQATFTSTAGSQSTSIKTSQARARAVRRSII